MAGKLETGSAATSPYALTSDKLIGVLAVRGTAKLLEEKPISFSGSNAPSLYQRRFDLTNFEVIRNGSTALQSTKSITFSGFTSLAPVQRFLDSRSPILQLEGQEFFDSKLPTDSINVLLLIGGSEIPPIPGLVGNSTSVESGVYKNQPVRVFLTEGADATLPQAFPFLVGWQAKPTIETAEAAIKAPHPLIAIDALRIAARLGISDQVEILARWLLHPVQSAKVKAIAIKVLGQAVNNMPLGSTEADHLIDLAVMGWEAEHAYQIDAAYLSALQSVSPHIKRSNQLERVRAISDDYQTRELVRLSERLKQSLKN